MYTPAWQIIIAVREKYALKNHLFLLILPFAKILAIHSLRCKSKEIQHFLY